jgi:hypothetical protein
MVMYRECLKFKGPEKVYCLIDAIKRDYRSGVIDRETAKRRLIYLVALNRANGWMGEESLKRLVASALEDLGIEVKRGELGRYMKRREAVAVTA